MARKNRQNAARRARILEVCTAWVQNVADEEVEDIACFLDELLNIWADADRFGTEGQCDPRGDLRDRDGDYPSI